MNRRRLLLRSGAVALAGVVLIVLPATVHSLTLYLLLAAPCLIAAGVLGWLDADSRK